MKEFLEDKRFYYFYVFTLITLALACFLKVLAGVAPNQEHLLYAVILTILGGAFIWYQSFLVNSQRVKMLCTSVTALLILIILYGIPAELSSFKIPNSLTGLSTVGRFVIEHWSNYFSIPDTDKFYGSFTSLFIFVLFFPIVLIGIVTNFKRALGGFLVVVVTSVVLSIAVAYAYVEILIK